MREMNAFSGMQHRFYCILGYILSSWLELPVYLPPSLGLGGLQRCISFSGSTRPPRRIFAVIRRLAGFKYIGTSRVDHLRSVRPKLQEVRPTILARRDEQTNSTTSLSPNGSRTSWSWRQERTSIQCQTLQRPYLFPNILFHPSSGRRQSRCKIPRRRVNLRAQIPCKRCE